MRQTNIQGLKAGQLEMVSQHVEAQYGLVKDDFEVDDRDPIFNALKEFCISSNFPAEVEKINKKLETEEEKFTNYSVITEAFLNTPQKFPTIRFLSSYDLDEVHYAMQNALFNCLCKAIRESKKEEEYAEWIANTHTVLQEKYKALSKEVRLKPAFNKSEFIKKIVPAAFGLMFSVGIFVHLAYTYNRKRRNKLALMPWHEEHELRQTPFLSQNPRFPEFELGDIPLFILLIGIAFCFYLLLHTYQNARHSQLGYVLPRTVFAKPPILPADIGTSQEVFEEKTEQKSSQVCQ